MWISRKKWARRETKSTWSIFFHVWLVSTCINLFNLADVVSRWAFLERRHCTRKHGHMQMVFSSILLWFAPWCPCINSSIYDSAKKRLRYWTETCLQTVISIKHIDLQKISREMVFNLLDAKWWFQTWIHFSPHLGEWSNSTAAISFQWAETTNWILLNDLF